MDAGSDQQQQQRGRGTMQRANCRTLRHGGGKTMMPWGKLQLLVEKDNMLDQ